MSKTEKKNIHALCFESGNIGAQAPRHRVPWQNL